ncbi:MAG: GNAT family N-acetyltransferase [Bacteroidia bacterium]|nr:GNAT family N-acetyltransferase [Bacteroidia bacterium]
MNRSNNITSIETNRLILRGITEKDVDEIFILRSDSDMMQFIPRPKCKDKTDALALIRIIQMGIQKRESVNWGITLKGENKLIGTIGFVRMQLEHHKAEIGYMLHKDYYRQGIMQEALDCIIKHGFETMSLHRIEAVIDPENIASEKLLIKSGFVKEGHFKENFLFENKYLDSVYYALLNHL